MGVPTEKPMGRGRRVVRDLALPVGLACLAALVPYLFGLRGPGILVFGTVIGLGTFVLLEWGDKIATVTGWAEVPITFKVGRLRFHPPARAGNRKLRRDSFALVAEITTYVQSQPSSVATSSAEFQARTREMKAAKTKDARYEVFSRHGSRTFERTERESQQMLALFGGRIKALAAQYRRRGLLDDATAYRLDWFSTSLAFLPQAAAILESLARQL